VTTESKFATATIIITRLKQTALLFEDYQRSIQRVEEASQ